MTTLLWLGVALLGGGGAVLRHLVDRTVSRRTRTWPWGTLAVNLTGSLALGVLHGAGVASDVLLLLGAGLVGAFTTFSTWVAQTRGLAAEGRPGAAAANVLVSLVVGFGLVALGSWVGGRW